MTLLETAKESLQYGVLGASAGAILVPLADYLDGSVRPLYYSVPMGALGGFIIGQGAGMMLNSTRAGKITPLTVALPTITGGGTALALKAYPNTSSISYKRLISAATIAGVAGLLTGLVIENQRNR
jgi:hypothetical protein